MTVEVKLSPQELTSTIEALRDGVLRRVRWATSPQFTAWRDQLPLSAVQIVMDSMVSAYTKLFFEYNDATFEKIEEFTASFNMPDEMWEILAQITTAEKWEDIPLHDHHDVNECISCKAMSGMT